VLGHACVVVDNDDDELDGDGGINKPRKPIYFRYISINLYAHIS